MYNFIQLNNELKMEEKCQNIEIQNNEMKKLIETLKIEIDELV